MHAAINLDGSACAKMAQKYSGDCFRVKQQVALRYDRVGDERNGVSRGAHSNLFEPTVRPSFSFHSTHGAGSGCAKRERALPFNCNCRTLQACRLASSCVLRTHIAAAMHSNGPRLFSAMEGFRVTKSTLSWFSQIP